MPKPIQLPLPAAIEEMFPVSVSDNNDEGHHQGRSRLFPHVRGNWAAFVFLKCKFPICYGNVFNVSEWFLWYCSIPVFT